MASKCGGSDISQPIRPQNIDLRLDRASTCTALARCLSRHFSTVRGARRHVSYWMKNGHDAGDAKNVVHDPSQTSPYAPDCAR